MFAEKMMGQISETAKLSNNNHIYFYISTLQLKLNWT